MHQKTMEIRKSAGFRNIRFEPYAGAIDGGLGNFFCKICPRALKTTDNQRQSMRAHGRREWLRA